MEKSIDELKKTEAILSQEPVIQRAVEAVIQTWIEYMCKKNGYQIVSSLVEKEIHLMGSQADGFFSARFYSEKTLTFEADFLLEVGQLQSGNIKPVSGKPGFYTVKTEKFEGFGSIAKMIDRNPSSYGFVTRIIKETTESGILPGDLVKKLQKNVSGLYDELPHLEKMVAMFLKTCEEDKIQCTNDLEFNGPAVTLMIKTCLNNKLLCILSVDIVLGFSLNFWPPEAEDWQHRERKWPPQDIVDGIKDHAIHLVAKPVDKSSESSDTEWRLTFMAEKKLIQDWSPEMKLTYYIFKILFYAYFIEVQCEEMRAHLSSYLAKTTMYWACEEYDLNDWTKDRMADNLKRLLNKLLDFFRSGILPHYFVPAINLLSNVPETLLASITEMDLSDLLEDPINSIPPRHDYVRKFLGDVEQLCPALVLFGNGITYHLPDKTTQYARELRRVPDKPFEFAPAVDDDDLD